MNRTDFVAMLAHVSQALLPVDTLISGVAYLLGLIFIIKAIGKLKKIGDARVGSGSQEKMFIPLAYLMGGAALLFLPSTLVMLSNTTFGNGNILQYSSVNPYDIKNSMGLVIKTAGLIWFVRGCVLLIHSSEPGVKDGPKGLVFLFAGVLAMNFEGTVGWINYIINQMMSFTHMGQSSTGSGSGGSKPT